MIDMKTKLIAEEFVRYLRSSDEMKRFQAAKVLFENDPELRTLKEEFTLLAKEFQQKQHSQSITQGEIDRMRSLQRGISMHPRAVQFAKAQEAFMHTLRDCNTALSEELGFDFAATAMAAASC